MATAPITFKAGKMIREGKMLKPDERKGLVTVSEQDDGLLHFCWASDRAGRNTEDDLILFPGDAKLERVREAGEKSRVYLLRFEGNPPRQFYWMQEPDEAKDEILVKALNEALGASDDSMEQ